MVPGRPGQATLPWRKQHGLECALCPWAIQNSEEYGAKNRSEIARENAESKPKHAKYMDTCVKPYEQMKLHSKGKKVKEAVHGRGRKQGVTVTAHQYASLDYEKNLGILWPVKELAAGKVVLKKKDLTLHMINGQTIRGLLRGEEFGCPAGCHRLTQKSGSSTSMGGAVGDTADDLENETEDLFRHCQIDRHSAYRGIFF